MEYRYMSEQDVAKMHITGIWDGVGAPTLGDPLHRDPNFDNYNHSTFGEFWGTAVHTEFQNWDRFEGILFNLYKNNGYQVYIGNHGMLSNRIGDLTECGKNKWDRMAMTNEYAAIQLNTQEIEGILARFQAYLQEETPMQE